MDVTTARVLVVDDDEQVRAMLVGALQRFGCEYVAEAVDGQAALAAIAVVDGVRNFDLVISDNDMPRLGGLGLLGWIRQHRDPEIAGMPFLLATGKATPEVQERAAALCARVLAKPFTLQELREAIEETPEEALQRNRPIRDNYTVPLKEATAAVQALIARAQAKAQGPVRPAADRSCGTCVHQEVCYWKSEYPGDDGDDTPASWRCGKELPWWAPQCGHDTPPVFQFQGPVRLATVSHRGWPGHFIQNSRCRFHCNTLIEFGETRVVVSTVGHMIEDDRVVPIGSGGRTYETMVFHAELDEEGVWEAGDRQVEIRGQHEWTGFNDLGPQRGHDAIVKEIVDRLEAGEKL